MTTETFPLLCWLCWTFISNTPAQLAGIRDEVSSGVRPSSPALNATSLAPMGGFFLHEGSVDVGEFSGEIGISIFRDFAETFPAASVEIVTRDGTAKAGLDFVAIQQTVHFEEGQTFARVPLTLINNARVDGVRTFMVVLESPSAGESLRSPHVAVYRVIDDDDGTSFSVWTEASGYVGEGAGSGPFSVGR